MGDRSEIARYLENWQDEVDSAAEYHAMAAGEPDPRLATVYTNLAAMEEAHIAFWEARLRTAAAPVPPRRPSWRSRVLGGIARRFGPELVLATIAAKEEVDQNAYLAQPEAAATRMSAQERWHATVLRQLVATQRRAVSSRLGKPLPGGGWIAATALTVSTAATLAYVIGGVVVQVRPWWEPQYIIPIAGMILGNSMTSAALAGDRLQGDLRARADEVEARLALGFSGREAVQPMVRASLRAAMIPTVNGMMTVGVVQLPGMMTGQILAGSSPLVAIRYQMVVVFMLAAATALGSLLFVRLAADRYLTAAHQLRRYLL